MRLELCINTFLVHSTSEQSYNQENHKKEKTRKSNPFGVWVVQQLLMFIMLWDKRKICKEGKILSKEEKEKREKTVGEDNLLHI